MSRIPHVFAAVLLAGSVGVGRAENPVTMNVAAPELAGIGDWANAKPFTLKSKRGSVVVLHFWTFGCVNCVRNLPAYNAWHKDYAGKGVTVLGVHTPEFDREKDPARIKAAVTERKIEYPVAVDNTWATWKSWENQYWPAVYLIDKRGFVRSRWTGELAWDGAKGDAVMRKALDALLAEPAPSP